MSFSSDVKQELCAIRTDTAAAEAECHGMLVLCRSFSFSKILLQTGCRDVAERFCTLLRHGFDVICAVKEGGKARPTYTVEVVSEADRKRILYRLGYKKAETLSIDLDSIFLTFSSDDTASSITLVTEVSTSSGAAPGYTV